VIEATVTLARGMGQKTVAEGVETESALAIVRELGVDYAQGYLFARPAPAEQLLPLTRQEP
jgi:EAL domain-containing protein (putative c-di-GMP-specific phosphodiesterase class I)